MPNKPPSPCTYPGCPALIVGGGRCPKHAREQRREADSRRPSSTARGYGYRWQRYREVYLQEHPLCVTCKAEGQVVAATVVDHIVPHRGDDALMWDPSNHQSQCKRCHDRKTATSDGGFGARRDSQGNDATQGRGGHILGDLAP